LNILPNEEISTFWRGEDGFVAGFEGLEEGGSIFWVEGDFYLEDEGYFWELGE
jgi:hypothetical protein